jgi:hypothetical protein
MYAPQEENGKCLQVLTKKFSNVSGIDNSCDRSCCCCCCVWSKLNRKLMFEILYLQPRQRGERESSFPSAAATSCLASAPPRAHVLLESAPVHTHMCVGISNFLCMHRYVHTRTRTRTHTRTRARARTHTRYLDRIPQSTRRVLELPLAQLLNLLHRMRQQQVCLHLYTHACACVCVSTPHTTQYTRTHAHNTYTRTRARTHNRTRTHTRTHTHLAALGLLIVSKEVTHGLGPPLSQLQHLLRVLLMRRRHFL